MLRLRPATLVQLRRVVTPCRAAACRLSTCRSPRATDDLAQDRGGRGLAPPSPRTPTRPTRLDPHVANSRPGPSRVGRHQRRTACAPMDGALHPCQSMTVVVPHVPNHPIGRHDTPLFDQQQSNQRPALGPAQLDRSIATHHLKAPQHTKLQWRHPSRPRIDARTPKAPAGSVRRLAADGVPTPPDAGVRPQRRLVTLERLVSTRQSSATTDFAPKSDRARTLSAPVGATTTHGQQATNTSHTRRKQQ
jgi:hypothetical protein